MKNRLIILLVSMFVTSTSYATIIVNVNEVGADVVVSYSGALDLDSTDFKEADRNASNNSLWDIGNGGLQTYNTNGQVDDYNLDASSITRPVVTDIFGSILTGGTISGDFLLVDISSHGGQIWVSDGYLSNSYFSGTNVFSNSSFSDLSPVIGTYEWSWFNGSSSDNLILNVGQAQAVPEPASIAMFGLALVGIGFWRKRK